jgi:peptidoglycan/LPS O-acetylase OafA/YrhL
VTLQTGEGINPENNWHAEWMLKELAPNAMPQYRAAAQQQDMFDFTAINIVQVPVAFLSMAGLMMVFGVFRKRRRHQAALALTVALALLGNAAICGIFSNPNARYQSRIMPAAVLVVIIAGLAAQPPRRVNVARESQAT